MRIIAVPYSSLLDYTENQGRLCYDIRKCYRNSKVLYKYNTNENSRSKLLYENITIFNSNKNTTDTHTHIHTHDSHKAFLYRIIKAYRQSFGKAKI